MVNNAGFGFWGRFENINPERQIEMINVNIIALIHLTRLFIQDMIKAGFGKILNVASIAAFQPMALVATYAATKTFVLYFSKALDVELEAKGICVSVLCPPEVKTNFQKETGNSSYNPLGPFANSVEEVTRITIKELLKNKKIIKPWKISGKILMDLSKLFPQRMAVKKRMKIHEKKLLYNKLS